MKPFSWESFYSEFEGEYDLEQSLGIKLTDEIVLKAFKIDTN